MTQQESPRRYGSGDGRHTGPRRSDEQESPEPERLETPAEEAGVAPHQLDDPPQAEGPRDEEEDDAGGEGDEGERRGRS
jgi:hypothetical protein